MTPATFACGMPSPWAPGWWEYPPSPVIHQPPGCDHCFCEEPARGTWKREPHLRCCKCNTLMAERFVKAWFDILAPTAP